MTATEEIKAGIDVFVEKSSRRLEEVNRKVTIHPKNFESKINSFRFGKTLSWLTKNISHTIQCVQFLRRTDSK